MLAQFRLPIKQKLVTEETFIDSRDDSSPKPINRDFLKIIYKKLLILFLYFIPNQQYS